MSVKNKRLNIVRGVISRLDLDVGNYKLNSELSDQENNNLVYVKGYTNAYDIKFISGISDCSVFIGDGKKGKLNLIRVEYSSSIIYIGDNCNLKNLSLRGGNIFIGDSVSSHVGRWQSGTHSRELMSKYPKLDGMIVVGDDCMFSRDINIRTSDAHPVLNIKDRSIVNTTEKSVVIGPHTWVCENANIMKGVEIGACSIVALGAIVTKSTVFNGSVAGIPAKYRALNGKVWSRNTAKKSIDEAAFYYDKYVNTTESK